jgi:hypothetical protein
VYDGDKTINGGWGKKNEALIHECDRLRSTRKKMQTTYYRHMRYNLYYQNLNHKKTYHYNSSKPRHIAWNQELLKALKFFTQDSTQKKDWIRIVQKMSIHFSEFKYNFTRENVQKAYQIHIKDK